MDPKIDEVDDDKDIELEIDDDELLAATDEEINPNVADQLAHTAPEGTQTIEARYNALKESDPELAEYHGKNVKKRIDKMTFKLREGERQAAEALTYAQGVLVEKTELEKRLENQDGAFIGEHKTRLQSEIDAANAAYYDAYNNNDPEAMAKATASIARVSGQMNNAEMTEQRFNRKREENKGRPAPVYQPPQPQPQGKAKVDARTEQWAEDNEWFGQDEEVTKAAMAIHKQLIPTGLVPGSTGYFVELDKRLRTNYPDKDYWGKDVSVNDDPPPVTVSQVTPVQNGVPIKRGNRNTIRLSASQRSVARKLGITDQQYAKSLQAMQQAQ